jgi:HSP20 family protein
LIRFCFGVSSFVVSPFLFSSVVVFYSLSWLFCFIRCSSLIVPLTSFFLIPLSFLSCFFLPPPLQKDKEFLVHADVPGIPKEDLKVKVENDVLTISGERKQEKKEEGENFRRVERSFGQVSRSLRLPKHVVSDKISAKHENGVLVLTLPKAPESAKTQEIKIS